MGLHRGAGGARCPQPLQLRHGLRPRRLHHHGLGHRDTAGRHGAVRLGHRAVTGRGTGAAAAARGQGAGRAGRACRRIDGYAYSRAARAARSGAAPGLDRRHHGRNAIGPCLALLPLGPGRRRLARSALRRPACAAGAAAAGLAEPTRRAGPARALAALGAGRGLRLCGLVHGRGPANSHRALGFRDDRACVVAAGRTGPAVRAVGGHHRAGGRAKQGG